jgi:hypothetical protein
VEEAHLETGGTVAFVDADALDGSVGGRWESEFDEIFDVAAVAGAVVGFEIRHDQIVTWNNLGVRFSFGGGNEVVVVERY